MTSSGGFGRLGKKVGCLWPVLGVMGGFIAVALLLGVGAATRSAQVARFGATPALIRIPRPSATPSAQPTAVLTPTPTLEVFGPAGPIALGDLIEVFGTSGDGVRLRSAPDLEATINGLGMDSDVFQVDEGPVESEGRVWWYLVNPYDPAQQGWAVADYLRPLQGP
jgi:hypothetical protein